MSIRTVAKVHFQPFDVEAIAEQARLAATQALESAQDIVRARLVVVVGTTYMTYDQQREAGHPYSKASRGAGLTVSRNYVNKQSGAFYEGIQTYIGRGNQNGVTMRLMSLDEKTPWIGQGTGRMIPRYWISEVMNGVREEFMTALTVAISSRFRVTVGGK